MNCAKCGLPVAQGATSCGSCGSQIAASPAVSESPQISAPPQAAPIVPAQDVPAIGLLGIPCTKCGNQLEAGAKFCNKCGQSVGSATTNLKPTPSASEQLTITPTPSQAAPVGTPAYAVPKESKLSALLYFIPVIILILLGIGVWKLATTVKPQQLSLAASKVETDCYTFHVSNDMKTSATKAACESVAQSAANSVAVKLAGPQLTIDNMKTFAEQDFVTQAGPTSVIETEQDGLFAGEPSYKITTTVGAKHMAYYYVYDHRAGAIVTRNLYHAYLVVFGSTQNVDSLATSVENSWVWLSRDNATPEPPAKPSASNGDTSCYQIQLPVNAAATTARNCVLSVTYGARRYSRLKVDILIGGGGQATSVAPYVASWKRASNDLSTIISEAPIKVAGMSAEKIVYRYKDSQDTEITVLIYVGPKYTVNGYPTDGFEVTGGYSATNGEAQAVDAVLSNWRWK